MIDMAREAGLASWERMARTDWLVTNLGWLTDPAALHASAPDREHLAMLQSWARIWLDEQLLRTDVPEDPFLGRELERYFPAPMRRRIGPFRLAA